MSYGDETSFAERLTQKLFRLFTFLILAFVTVSCFRPMMDNVDVGWHIAQGRWMVEHGAIYRHDVLDYPNLNHRLVNEYPLFQVVLYGAWCLGWWGPSLLTALGCATLIFVFLQDATTSGLQDSSLVAMSLGLLLFYLELAFPLRPHLATFLGIAILGTFLLRHRHATTWIEFWPMALLQIAWTNSHSGFVIGPLMVGLFGAEMIVRHGMERRAIPWTTLGTWLGAFVLILLACLVNPFGVDRFYPPFYQDSLESIRAYVGEMQPLHGAEATLYRGITLLTVLVALVSLVVRRAFSWSFLLLAVLFYVEAISTMKAWPIFGLFISLLVLSSGTFTSITNLRKTPAWLNGLGLGVVVILIAVAVMMRFDGTSITSVQGLWREYDHGRSPLPVKATAWMKLHLVEGRLFHRCEDGGWLQEIGYCHGETFADSGFGKYDEAFIHEVGLVGERPALLPHYLKAYQPDFVVCGNLCYQWPYYLRQQGWRPIFYCPNSSVWTQPNTRPELPSVSDEQIEDAFDRDITLYGRPSDPRIFGRNLITLNSLGLEDFAFTTLKSLPDDLHHTPWYWEAARIFCFEEPKFSTAHRDDLLHEAEQLHEDALTAEFRAYCHQAEGDTDGALRILENIPTNQLSNYTAELLLKIYLDRKRPEALALARRTDCWDLRNGRHWEYLAQAEDQAGNPEAAAQAWEKAVFYYPDDAVLMQNAANFHHDQLQRDIEQSGKVYGN